MGNICGIRDVKEQIWFTNVKYLWLSLTHIRDIIILYGYTRVYNFKSYWYKREKSYKSAK